VDVAVDVEVGVDVAVDVDVGVDVAVDVDVGVDVAVDVDVGVDVAVDEGVGPGPAKAVDVRPIANPNIIRLQSNLVNRFISVTSPVAILRVGVIKSAISSLPAPSRASWAWDGPPRGDPSEIRLKQFSCHYTFHR
jgi:hypothetical protein